jgi:hypothetical protein
MISIKIYGASDDLIEVEGDVPGCDEFNHYSGPGFVELSTGDVFKVEYTHGGVWTVDHLKATKAVQVSKEPHGEGDDPEPYTDTAIAMGPVKWVEFWKQWPPTGADRREKVERFFEHGGLRDEGELLTDALYEVIRKYQRGES